MRMQENVSLLIWDKLRELVDAEIEQKTAACVRMKSMVVTTAYDAQTQTVGVTEAFGTEVQLPVCGDVDGSSLTVGESVWVMLPYGMSNALVVMRGDGAKPTAYTAQDIAMSADDPTTAYDAILNRARMYPQAVTLTAAGWAQNGDVWEQTAAATGITADGAQTSAIATPSADSAQADALTQAKVRMTAQGDGTLTFACPTQPGSDLTVNVLVLATGV